jgi:sensor histidine kinase YesM
LRYDSTAMVNRTCAQKSANEWVRLDEEIGFVQAYLQVEQSRFGDRLKVVYDVAPDAASALVPAMSLQPLVENAIKHGVSVVEGPAAIALSAKCDGEWLAFEVGDNGPGFPPGFSLDEAGNGGPAAAYGLRNVAGRLRGYYGSAARIEWSRKGGQTTVRVSRRQRLGGLLNYYYRAA